ncbi:hypothetical protein H2198_000630 [Neophaeococcomyces mojaviensis]|uniref:Uncharacterized protein n=1 Tax=Neophaeococcomyces mojaviensis TaxID=3383035 RepID=A0ACC3AJZ7_9EURO|nr:hypothetical protein H2198_000630 [Knufia sp. JES_112]
MKSFVSPLNFLLAITAIFSSTTALPPGNWGNQGPGRPSASSTQVCGTRYGPRYGPVSTSRTTTTSTIKSTTLVTSTGSTTITPPASTSTIVSTTTIVTSVTASVPTSVSTSTVTSVLTQTATVDSTITNTSTATSTTSLVATTTVSAPAGFTPIASSLPGTGLKKREISVRSERGQSKRGGFAGPNPIKSGNSWSASGNISQLGRNPRQGGAPGYPNGVQCTITVYTTSVVTSTRTIQTTLTASTPTVVTTSTVSATTTSTILPGTVTSTATSTSTITSVSTSTNIVTASITVTSTVSVTTSTTTVYAACASNNVVGSYQGGGLVGWGFTTQNFNAGLSTYNADSPVDCCVLAATNSGSWFYNFYPTVPVGAGNCDIIIASTCPVPTTATVDANGATTSGHATVYYDPAATPSAFQVSGNGPCGVVQNALS